MNPGSGIRHIAHKVLGLVRTTVFTPISYDADGNEVTTPNGSLATNVIVSNGSGFTPSSMGNITLTMDGTVKTQPLATGVTKLQVFNAGGAGDTIFIAFGATEAEAIENLTFLVNIATTGHPVYSVADVGSASLALINVPAAAYSGWCAVCNASVGGDSSVVISQGV